jgi:tartrate-resistant acid phosphatase type 5
VTIQETTVRKVRGRAIALGVCLCIAGCHSPPGVKGSIQIPSLPVVEPPPVGTTRFAVIGDYGSGSPIEGDVALMIRNWAPEFIATVGDNYYPGGTAETIDDSIGRYYHPYIAPYKGGYGPGASRNRFFPIPGHRDWDYVGLRPYLEYFTLPGNERYYDVVWGPMHLYMLDTDEREPDGATADSIQGRWLEERLKTSNAPWKLVFAHHAPYTSHSVPATSRMRWPFKAWGADAILSGYYHIYERLEVGGLPYFVNGAGGSWISQFGNIDNNSKFRYNDDFGAMLVDASATRITFRFVNRKGQILDEYFIEKRPLKMNE